MIVDKAMEEAFRQEKHKNIELRELIIKNQKDKEDLQNQINFLKGQKDVTFVSRNGNQIDLQRAIMSIEELKVYKEKIMRETEAMQRELNDYERYNPMPSEAHMRNLN